MNNKHRLWIAIVAGIIAILALSIYLLSERPSCCALPSGDYFTSTAIVATNQKIETQISQTQTVTAATATLMPSPTP